MSLYPTTVYPSFVYPVQHKFKTLISEADSGVEVRRSLFRFGKRIFTLQYNILTFAQRKTLLNFYRGVSGAYTAFYYKDWFLLFWYDEKVGYGDGSTLTFDLPSFTTTNDSTLKVYVAGVEKTKTTHWNFVSGGGTEGSDRITFTAGNAPASGALITTDFTGYLRARVRFEDTLDESILTPDYETIRLTLVEVPA